MFPRLEALMVFAVILGLIGGVYVSLMVVVIIDFMGINKLAPGFGLATMCMGLATIPIPVILGRLYIQPTLRLTSMFSSIILNGGYLCSGLPC